MESVRRPDEAAFSLDIPRGYLDSVEVRAYYLDLTLDIEKVNFSGRVRIAVNISGPARSVFFLHSAGLALFQATVGSVCAVITKNHLSFTGATRLEVPVEAAVCGESVIEVHFSGAISTWRPEGIWMLGRDNRDDFEIYSATSTGRAGGEGAAEGATGGRGNGKVGGAGAAGARGGGGRRADLKSGHRNHDNDSTTSNVNSSGRGGNRVLALSAGAVLGTHLEPTHARGLLPCVDLQNCKAVFHLTLRGVPRHLQAISNAPVSRVEAEGDATAVGADEGRAVKTVSFRPTPVMSTYVFGFWVGDFHCLTTHALATESGDTAALLCCETLVPKLRQLSPLSSRSEERVNKEDEQEEAVEINVHVLKTIDLEGAQFALDFARRAFELFSRLFSVRFPLPKLDLLGLSRMHGLGMENFGAVTLLQEYMLVTADTTFVRRRRIARLICHEVCHQWYGDIVTPVSFDELWLKEGLARFFEYVAVDALDPSYRAWTNFMSEVFFQAMLADSQKNSHPVVQQHNGNIASIMQSFDTITYCKGASVLRMLCHCVGPARFLEGTRRFVVDHQYACATQEDLWKAVQGVCDRDGIALNVRDLMRPWLTCAMFPVLRVRMSAPNTLNVVQQPFSLYPRPERARGVELAGKVDCACRDGAGGAKGGDGGANSTKVLRRGAPADVHDRSNPAEVADLPLGAPRPVDAQRHVGNAAGDGPTADRTPEPAAATEGSDLPGRRGEDSGPTNRWIVPLRIRVANGSWSGPSGAARGPEGGDRPFDRASGGQPGEETHRFLMAEESASISLRGFSCDAADGSGGGVGGGGARTGGVAEGEEEYCTVNGERSRVAGGARRPYLVVNDCHSGFFTVQYECEKSWALALAALEEGVLSECEAMGFVNDLILGLHEGVLVDREAASACIGAGRGGMYNGYYCDVPRLFSRLQNVVRLLGRDRSHPAWCAGQLFIWELLIMCASNALGEIYEAFRRRREVAVSRHLSDLSKRNGFAKEATASGAADNGIVVEQPADGPHTSGPSRSAPHASRDTGSPSRTVDADDIARQVDRGKGPRSAADAGGEGSTPATATAPAARSVTDGNRTAAEEAARVRLFRVMTDMELAFQEVEEHVRWHGERVEAGVEQAAEALQSLRDMRDRLQRCRSQLMLDARRFDGAWDPSGCAADSSPDTKMGGERVGAVGGEASTRR